MKSRLVLIVSLLCIISSSFLTTSCKKKDITEVIHTDTTINGNTPPNYTGVPTISITQYVNKLFVDVLGRQPTSTESSTDVNYLITNNLTDSSRSYIINKLFADSSFYNRMYDLTSAEYINGTANSDIVGQLQQFGYIKILDSLNNNSTNVYYDNYEIGRLNSLLTATPQLKANQITMNEYYRRFLDNYFFDQVNMGTENFCKASFEDLFNRDPTASELSSSENMVNGSPATVFLQSGSDKGTFEKIVTTTDEFYEGYTIRTYLLYLLRTPTSDEEANGMTLIKPTGNYKSLQLQILKSKEYAGF